MATSRGLPTPEMLQTQVSWWFSPPSPSSVTLFLTDQLSHQAQNKPSCHPSMGPLHQDPMEHSFQPFEGAETYPFYRREAWGPHRACQLSSVAFLNALNGEVLNQIQSTAWRIKGISTEPRKGKMILPGDRQCKVNDRIPVLSVLLNKTWFSTRAGSNKSCFHIPALQSDLDLLFLLFWFSELTSVKRNDVHFPMGFL